MQRVGIPMSSNIGGDVFQSFAALNDIIKKNDGIRSFSIKTNSCYDSDAPVSEGSQTHIRITNSYHDINQLDETYLRCKWKATIHTDTKFTAAANQPIQIFVGWKNAAEAIRQIEVENNNTDCDYLQTEAAREAFCYATYKPEEEKKNRKYAHSRWTDVERCIPGVAGKYINVTSTTAWNANTTKEVTFETCIPINDILAFQAFEEFPGCLGDIVLKLYFTRDSMVFGSVDPNAAIENAHFWDSDDSTATHLGKKLGCWGYTRGFTQCGSKALMPITTDAATANCKCDYVGISVTQLELVNLYCDVAGYNVTQECKRNIAQMFTPEHPLIIPAQHIDVKNMPKKYNKGEPYDADFTYALHNVTDFVTVFPLNAGDQTCFYNPIVTNLQLRCDGKLYPTNKLESTEDYRFYQMMMNASDLDNYYEADQSYSNSLLGKVPVGFNVKRCTPYDVSSFLCTFQAERNTKGYCFDGIETGNTNVNIGLSFNAHGSWYDAENNGRPSPQIWFTRDTYWTVDNVNGLKYHKTGTPPIYASSED